MPQRTLRRSFFMLIVNHADAWGVTLVIAMLALLLHEAINPLNLLLVTAITVSYWLAFAYNDYCDAPYDAKDPGKARRNFFVNPPVTAGQLKLGMTLVVAFVTLVFLQYGGRGLLVLAMSMFIVWGYSAHPLRLKSRPGLDLLTHAIFVQTYPYFITTLLIDRGWLPVDIIMLAMFFCASLAAQLEQQARDYEVDSLTDRNFTTSVGLRYSIPLLKVTTGLLIAIAVFGFVSRELPLILVPFGLITLPVLLHRFARRDRPRSERLVMVATVLALIYGSAMLGYFLLI